MVTEDQGQADEGLIICKWQNQINHAKFNLYDYSVVTAITCCYACTVHFRNLVIGIILPIRFMVNH